MSLSRSDSSGDVKGIQLLRYSFAWNGIEASLATTYAAASAQSSSSFTFADNGTFPVKARVFDKDGGITTYSRTVTVNNVAPTAVFNAPHLVQQGAPVVLSFDNPTDAGSADKSTLRYSFAFDGLDTSLATDYAAASASNSASSTFTSPGTYKVIGRIFDKDGAKNTYVAEVLIVRTSQFGTSNGDSAHGVAVDSTGVYVTGNWDIANTGDAFVRKYDNSGGVLWTKQI